MSTSFDDGLGFDAEETASERLARELAEADLRLIAQIRAKREERGLTQRQLGRLLNVSQATVSEFESGQIEPRMQTIRRYAHALGIRIEHTVRDADLGYQLGDNAIEVMMPRGGFRSNPKPPRYSAISNSKRTDFGIAA